MIEIKRFNLLYAIQFVIVEHLHVKPIQQIQIDFIAIVSNGYNEVAFGVQPLDLILLSHG